MSLNYVDIILLVPVAVGLVRGLFRGLIKEVLSLAGLVLGVVVAYLYADLLAESFRNSFSTSGSWIDILSYIILFALTVIIVNLLAKYLTSVSKVLALGFLNRLAGGAFGMLKVLLILMLILHLFGPWLAQWRKEVPEWKKSQVYDLLEEYSFIPGDLFDKASEEIEQKEWDFPTIETP